MMRLRNQFLARIFLLFAVKLAFNFVAVPFALADEQSDRRASALFDSVMSPYCPGVTLSACASEKATSLRNDIRTWIADGLDEQQIQSKLVNTYGATILGVPNSDSGPNFGLWGPSFVFLLGLMVTTLVLRTMVKRENAKSAGTAGVDLVDPRIEEMVEQQLKLRREKKN